MIYPSETDIIPFLKGLTLCLTPYAKANDVDLSFSSDLKKQVVHYQPYLLSQSITQLICNIINLLPPKSNITIRLSSSHDHKDLHVEIENSSINLMPVNEVSARSVYSFTGSPRQHGTLYRLVLPIAYAGSDSVQPVNRGSTANNLPQFYREIQKRLHSHFTQTDKLMATLEQNRPHEAAFIQKVNTLIKVNLDDESFNTDSLCKAMHMSRTQLFRRLKALIKQAPANYIRSFRLQKAKELLETTDLTISEIAFKTGFQTISHFSKVYKKQYDILPSVFRQSARPATNE